MPESACRAVKTVLHSVDDQPDADSVHAQFDKLLDSVTGSLPTVRPTLVTAAPTLATSRARRPVVHARLSADPPPFITVLR
jgi:hypothetical protein